MISGPSQGKEVSFFNFFSNNSTTQCMYHPLGFDIYFSFLYSDLKYAPRFLHDQYVLNIFGKAQDSEQNVDMHPFCDCTLIYVKARRNFSHRVDSFLFKDHLAESWRQTSVSGKGP